ncbi:MAG: OadG family protein [Gammaproteobacteria bacterium]|nr:OadG family protein [Gammaproteobacteria bacterium]
MTENLLQQGLELTVFGMGVVFVFLVLLIFVTRGMSYLALRYEGAVATEPAAGATEANLAVELEQSELIVVISAAIRQYRKINKI